MKSLTFASTLRTLGSIGFLLLLSAPAVLVVHADSHNSLVIRNTRVFDGHKVIAKADVWVEDGKIRAVGKNLNAPQDVKTIDGSGDTLLPGLIDSHTHAWGDALKEAEIFGVTTELDMFTDVKYMQEVKKAQAEGKDLDLADLRSAELSRPLREATAPSTASRFRL